MPDPDHRHRPADRRAARPDPQRRSGRAGPPRARDSVRARPAHNTNPRHHRTRGEGSMTTMRFPIRLDPIPGEAFDSWIDAYAHRLLMPSRDLAHALGIPEKLIRLRGANVAKGDPNLDAEQIAQRPRSRPLHHPGALVRARTLRPPDRIARRPCGVVPRRDRLAGARTAADGLKPLVPRAACRRTAAANSRVGDCPGTWHARPITRCSPASAPPVAARNATPGCAPHTSPNC